MQGRNIDTTTLKELFAEKTDGSFPVLLDIQSVDITWNDLNQENGHLRLINSDTPVIYQEKKYLPAYFEFTLPQEDGVKIGSTTITISAVDKRIIEVIRSVRSKPDAEIVAFFARPEEYKYVFRPVYRYKFKMGSCNWDNVTAQWSLVYDDAMNINVPKDTATKIRCPSISDD